MSQDIVLVTGGTGNIGSAFVALLASDARLTLLQAGPHNRVLTDLLATTGALLPKTPKPSA